MNHNLNQFKLIKLSAMILALLIRMVSFSAPVSEEKAQAVAYNFLKNADSRVNASSLEVVYTRENAFYIYGYTSGWVIVSGDDRVMPILGYSIEGAFPKDTIRSDKRGNNFWGQMLSYENQVKYVVENNISATYDISSQWENLKNGQSPRSTTTIVPPLLTTTWDQGWPYNELCPSDAGGPGGHVWTGCVATAMAQILKYHNYPNQGLGSYGYQWGSYPYTGANFGATTYNWSNMPNSISTSNLDIATIMYHTAVSCKSMWGAGSTGVGYSSDSDPMTRALVNYFKAAFSTIHYVESQYYTTTEWNNLIQAELTNNRPVYYRGDGIGSHAWVCDGVDASNMYHFNWGWGGSYNGYFALTAITPGGFNFTSNQHAIIGIKPNDGSTLVTNTTWSGNVNKTTNIAVPDAITLTTSPGAVINFAQDCKLQIWGKLTSIGTSSNYVKFTAIDTTTGWLGIKWDNSHMDGTVMADNDSSKLIYTQVEYSDQHGIFCQYYGKILIDHCKINNNDAGIWTAGIGQTNGYGGGISVWYQAISISHTEIDNNDAMIAGGGIYVSSNTSSVIINNNSIHDNLADISGGGFYLNNTINIIFNGNIINSNHAILGAGGSLQFGGPSIINNKFFNNSTIGDGKGGGLYIESCSPNVVNNLFTNNTRGGLYITTNSNPMLVNNTISNNSDPYYGGGIRILYNSNPSLKNTILYGNTAPDGSQISLETTDCDPYFDHCDVQGGVAGFGGSGAGSNYTIANYTNNIELDPVYISPSGGAGSGYDGLAANWQLQSTSPCINAGDTTGVGDLLPALDLGDNPRFNGVIDMGAYEYCAPDRPGLIAGETNPCQNANQAYAVIAITGLGYYWEVPGDWTILSGQGTHAISVAVGATSGTISVTPSNSCGSGPARTLIVNVGMLPSQPSAIAGNAQPCQGSSQNYSVSNTTAVTYTWELPAGWALVSGQGTHAIVVQVGTGNGVIQVTPGNSCGEGPAKQLDVDARTVPSAATAVVGAESVCQGENAVNYTVPLIPNASSYQWSLPLGASGSSTSNSISVSYGLGAVSGDISVKGLNECGEGEASTLFVQVNPLPAAATSINGPAEVCAGAANIVYSSPALAHADSYLWTLPLGASGSGTSNSISVSYGLDAVSGNISVRGVNACGEGEATSLFVQVNPLPGQPIIPIGPDTIDVNHITESQYTIAEVENATSYTWDLSPANAGSISGTTITASVVWNFNFLGDAFIKARAGNDCGQSEWSVEKQTFVENTVGMHEMPDCELLVYPNPVVGDQITISFCYKMKSVEIVDMNGSTLIFKQADSENYVLTHQLSSGMYFLKVAYNNGMISKKIVVE